jgi:molecular chaperone DnaJ
MGVVLLSFVPMAKDLYGILGVQKSASQDEVKAAYRKMSKEWHPDKHKGDKAAEQKFKEINEAYETLSNPQKRQMYDQFGSAGGPGGGGGNPFGGGFDFSQFQGGNGGMDFGDLFESFFTGGGGGRGRKQDQTRGDDREVEVTVDLLDTVQSAHRTVTLKKLIACETCSGNGAEPGSSVVTCTECSGTGQVTRTAQSFFGAIRQTMVCPVCAGSGKVPEKKCRTCSGEGRHKGSVDLTIDVPAGIADGQTLRITGQGDAGIRGGPAGDLYVRVAVRPDARFERDEADIRTTVTIPVVDAVLGTELEIETVHGPETIRIPEAQQPGQILRLKGKGLPILGTSRHGDHYVTVNVEIPKKLSREERRLMEEWRDLR